jgi:Na+/H+ antiporter NhaD/arsenite permease-like protein
MATQLSAIAIFIAVFAIAALRNVHLGILMFAAACGVGVWLGGIPLRDVVRGFPINIMVLLVGVTYFFAIAHVNGTIDRIITRALSRVGRNALVLPLVFFVLTAGIAAMGSPIAGLMMAPLGLPMARQYGLDPVLMALAIGNGITAGGFAPTSLFGIVSYGTAQQAGVDLSPFTLFTVSLVVNLLVLLASYLLFGKRIGIHQSRDDVASPVDASASDVGARFDRNQIATIVCMIGLIAAVLATAIAGFDPDIGVFAFAFGAVLALIDPVSGRTAVSNIDWSTVLLVGGIITFVGVLQTMGAVTMLGDTASRIGAPLMASLVICMIGALVSAFASTTGILAAIVPLAVPLITNGSVAGWALICAISVCAALVDVSPFSTTGATLVASAHEDERVRMTSILTRWGLSMVVIGPVALVGTLVLISSL